MTDIIQIAGGLLIPFAGTLLGAAMVFLLKDRMNGNVQKLLLGFAAGVMIAASVWSLLIPSMEMSVDLDVPTWVPAAAGFLCGICFLLLLDHMIPHLHRDTDVPEGMHTERHDKPTMLTFAVTLHNIPEGMAVGVVFAGVLAGDANITMAGAFALAIGIAIQNFPEGAIVSMPLVGNGLSKKRAFAYGAGSGIVEPIAAALVIILTSLFIPILPFLLAFAAGAMLYVVAEELIPESQTGKHSDIGTIGLAIGFVLMMVLDVALG